MGNRNKIKVLIIFVILLLLCMITVLLVSGLRKKTGSVLSIQHYLITKQIDINIEEGVDLPKTISDFGDNSRFLENIVFYAPENFGKSDLILICSEQHVSGRHICLFTFGDGEELYFDNVNIKSVLKNFILQKK